MISTMMTALALAGAGQATDSTRSAREAFTSCLRAYVTQSVEAQKPLAEFQTEYPTQCSTQEAAFRAAVIRRETTARMARAAAEQSARDEVEEARTNFSERFQMMIEPQ